MNFDTLFVLSKTFALVWFFLAFIAIVIWVYWPSRKKGYDEAATRILHDDDAGQVTPRNLPVDGKG
ncbi:MAG: cbb3-type cytochrome c oxidase subunit 3 [Magnetococcales bacterium]|nr:cbb3-type cytochrome c oxidase subunit 3 [Magnetococcales bacterium]MBF0321357.1 cbb3-type cytochrome c oxidase subunit 3 [Magnetococcales bacterium]